MKAIILYCSRTGNTENLVHRICRTIPADTLKVEPREPYGSYISSVLRVRKERKNNIIPEALTPAPDLAGYDLVFVGFPIWFNDIPAFFGSFLLRCNLREKTVIPFSTSTNSTILNSLTTLERICPDSILKYPFAHITLKRSDTSGWLSLLKTSCGAG